MNDDVLEDADEEEDDEENVEEEEANTTSSKKRKASVNGGNVLHLTTFRISYSIARASYKKKTI